MEKRSAILTCVAAALLAGVGPALGAPATGNGPLPLPPPPARIAAGEDYDHCLAMVDGDPGGAAIFADAWLATGGGDGAEHCLALADIKLGDPQGGAERLERLASVSRGPAAVRASVYGQAGQAWMIARQPDRAFAAETLALVFLPDDPDLLITRAAASGGLDRFQDAVEDLTRALRSDPRRVDALVFRAAAWRHLGRLRKAGDDLDRAFVLDAQSPEAHLERGILRQRRGDNAGAQEDWDAVVALSPGTQTADLAQHDLARMQAELDRR